MTIQNELAFMDAIGQAELVKKGEVKPIELVEAAIARIERLNPKLNAVVSTLYDEARTIAEGSLPEGPFAGVPFLIKDILAFYGGSTMTGGSKSLRDFVPDHDSELVIRLKKAGLIVLGKTNLPEFGILPTAESKFLGSCCNPWDTGRSTGGSSGGSAAAVASGMVPMAHANDGGGSIRIPAACCGVFGLKPTRARNPLGPDYGDGYGGILAEHAVTRSVRDSAALLDATSGPDIGDPYWAPPPARPFLEEVYADPGKLRIAYMTTLPNGKALHKDCVEAVERTAKLCAELGHHVEPADLKINSDFVATLFTLMWSAGAASTVKSLGLKKEDMEPLSWAVCEISNKSDPADYLIAVQTLQRVSRDVAAFFQNYDLLLTPTVSEPAVPLGTFEAPADDPMAGFRRADEFAPFGGVTPLCNITGQPAMSVPLFWNEQGLPIGSHFCARFGDEATLFRLAGQLERAQPWADRRPPVFA